MSHGRGEEENRDHLVVNKERSLTPLCWSNAFIFLGCVRVCHISFRNFARNETEPTYVTTHVYTTGLKFGSPAFPSGLGYGASEIRFRGLGVRVWGFRVQSLGIGVYRPGFEVKG